MMQVAPNETGILINALYESAEQNGRKLSLGVTGVSFFDSVKTEHDDAGIYLDTLDILEEIGARELQTIFNSPKEFNKWRAKLESDANLKKGWAKVVEYITDLIENIKNFVKQIGMTAEEKAKANELIAKLELYADAYKATINVVEQKNSQKDGEVKLNKGYNDKTSNSLKPKWHTGFTKTEIKKLIGIISEIGNPEATRITDTACWYKGRIEGQTVFAIYSTEYSANQTILYASKGAKAEKELNVLLKVSEAIENERSVVERTRIVNKVLGGNWVQEEHDLAYNDDRIRGRGSDTVYAPILQGKSSKFVGSPAFREVIGNLYDIQEASSNGRGIKKSLSLKAKNTDKTNNLLANIQETEKKKREVMSRFGLTIYEADAVVKYKTAESYKINAKLRNDETQLTEYQKEIVKLLDSALEKLPIHRGAVYRTVSFDDVLEGEAEYNSFLQQHTVGSVVEYGAYTSASSKIDGHPMPDDTKFGITLEIEGENGRDVEGFGNNFEKEVIYPRNLCFVVTEVRTDNKGRPYIKVKEIQNDGRLETSTEKQSDILQQMQTEGELYSDLYKVSERNTARGIDTENSVQRVRTDNEVVKVGETEKTAEISHSLKGGVEVSSQKTTEFLDTVEEVQHGKKGAAERLYKYVENGRLKT